MMKIIMEKNIWKGFLVFACAENLVLKKSVYKSLKYG